MNFPFLPSKVLILLVAACLVWVGLLSLAFVVLSGTVASTGFMVAGALVCAVVAWVLVMIREIRDSSEVPDFSAHGAREDGYDMAGQSTMARPASDISGRGFMGRRGMMPGRGLFKSRPRRVRSTRGVLSDSPSR